MPEHIQHIISPIRILAFVLFICTPVLSASAIRSETVQVRIVGDSPSGRLMVYVENANLGDILTQLALKFNFEFKDTKKISSDPRWSTTLGAGNLETLLQRLLRNRNHSITRSDGASGAISRVLLIETHSGSKLTPSRGPLRGNRLNRKAVKPGSKPGNGLFKTRNRKTP